MINKVNSSHTKLYVPHIKFNRAIGAHKDERWSTDGRRVSEEEWQAYAPTVLPSPADDTILNELFKNPAWIAPKGKNT